MKDEIYARDTTFSSDDRSTEQITQEIEQTRASMSDTLNALGSKLSPGQMMDEVLDYFHSNNGPAEFAASLGSSIKNNPIPVALVGIGVGWLMLAGSRSSSERRSSHSMASYRGSRPYSSSSSYETGASSGTAESQTSESSGGVLKESMEKLKSSAQEAWDKAAGAAQAAGDRMGQAAHQARERVGEAAHQVRDRMEKMAHSTQESMGGATSTMRSQTERLSSMARQQSKKAQEGFAQILQERPLTLGVVGLALGMALGAALPSTRRENEWMGSKRDELLERAETMGKEQLHKAERVVDAVQEAVREEAKQQGLTPGTVKETVVGSFKEQISQVQQKVERIAEAAKEAAKEEAERQNIGVPPILSTGKTEPSQQQAEYGDISLSGKP